MNVLVLENASNVEFDANLSHSNNSNDVLRLGHIGTLTSWDGLSELINAIYLAIKNDSNIKIKLIIVGYGTEKINLETLVDYLHLKAVITFHDPVPHNEAIELLHNIDVVPLLKTINDYGLSPIKYYESLAVGRTLIVSDIEHINEIPEYIGKVAKYPLDTKDISNILTNLYYNKENIINRVGEISQYAQIHHTWDKRIDKLLSKLKQIQ